MKLKQLTLKNFQGLEDFTLEFEKENLTITGDNALGKSRLLNAITWTLIDMTLDGQKTFDIVSNDKKDAPDTITSVKLIFEHYDEAEQILEKRYFKTYKVDQETGESTFQGFTKEYYINDLQVKEKEYNLEVSNLFGGDQKKLRTVLIPDFFETEYNLAAQREILIKLAGDSDNTDLLKNYSDEEQKIIKKYQKNLEKSFADAKKKKLQKKALIEKSQTILEFLQKDLTTKKETKLDPTSLETELREVLEQKNAIELLNVNTDLETMEATLNFKNKQYDEKRKDYHIEIEKTHLNELNKELEKKRQILEAYAEEKRQMEASIQNKKTLLQNLQFHGKNLKNNTLACPECQRHFSESEYLTYRKLKDDKLDDFEAKFYSMPLNELVKEFKGLNQAFQDEKAKYTARKEEMAPIYEEYQILNKRLQNLSLEQIFNDNPDLLPYEKLEETKQLVKEIKALDTKIQKEREKVKNVRESETFKLIIQRENELRTELATIKAFENELVKLEQDLNAKIAENQEHLTQYLEASEEERVLKSYIKMQNDTLTDAVNQNFNHVKIQFFDTLVNGETKIDCKILVKVPFAEDTWVNLNSANTATRINARLELSKALKTLWGIKCPYLIDNTESITKINELDDQIIKAEVIKNQNQLQFIFTD